MIVSMGEPMVEFNQVEERRYLQGYGGDTSNMIIAAARSGARTAYITREWVWLNDGRSLGSTLESQPE